MMPTSRECLELQRACYEVDAQEMLVPHPLPTPPAPFLMSKHSRPTTIAPRRGRGRRALMSVLG